MQLTELNVVSEKNQIFHALKSDKEHELSHFIKAQANMISVIFGDSKDTNEIREQNI